MNTSGEAERTLEAMEQAYLQADHYARVAARLLYDGREADARHYAARYASAVREAQRLRNLTTATGDQADRQGEP